MINVNIKLATKELYFGYYGWSRITVCNGQFEINKEITT